MCLVVGGTGVTALGDGSAPQRGVGVLTVSWLAKMDPNTLFASVGGGTFVVLKMSLKMMMMVLLTVVLKLLMETCCRSDRRRCC